MKGAKIRVVPSDLYQQLFTAFGAAATPMAFSEVPTVTNVIDGQENPYSVIVSGIIRGAEVLYGDKSSADKPWALDEQEYL